MGTDNRLPHGSATGLSLLALVCTTLFVFWPVNAFEFVVYDDPRYITANPQVLAGISRASLLWAFTSVGYAGNWHPLTWISHMIDIQAFGLQPRGHHLVSVLLHAASAGALFLVLKGMTGARWRSLLVAGLFAVHPLHVESVAWVAERKDVLAGLFWMLALGAYLQYARRRSLAWYSVTGAFFCFALMAKPMAMTLPAILLLLDWWPLGRFAPANARASFRTLLSEKFPFFVLGAGSAVITYVAQVRGRGFLVDSDFPFAAGLPNALISYTVYLFKTVFPVNLACFYPNPLTGPPLWQAVAAGLALVVLTAAILRRALQLPFLALGWSWYLVMLLPVIGVLQIGDQARADRYTYLPLIGVFLLAVWGGYALVRRRAVARLAALLVGGGVLCAFAFLSRAQVGTWRDSVTLFRHASETVADNWLAEYNLGTILAGERRFEAAAGHLATAMAIRPDHLEIRHNLGVCLYQSGRVEEAIGHFTEVIRLWPAYPDSRYQLGIALESRGSFREAAEQFSVLLRLRPGDAEARYHLAKSLRVLQR